MAVAASLIFDGEEPFAAVAFAAFALDGPELAAPWPSLVALAAPDAEGLLPTAAVVGFEDAETGTVGVASAGGSEVDGGDPLGPVGPEPG